MQSCSVFLWFDELGFDCGSKSTWCFGHVYFMMTVQINY